MASMAEEMKKKSIRATSVIRSKDFKPIDRWKVVELNRTMESIIRQNEHERVTSEQAIAGAIFGWKS